MSAAGSYLLDTNIMLHATRENSPISTAIETQFQLRSSSFRPTICEVTVAELWAFAKSWGLRRKDLLKRVLNDFVVVAIGDTRVHQRWAELYSFARSQGLAIHHDHNDVWIAATTHVIGCKLLSTDRAAFLPLRGTPWVDVVVLDPMTGIIVP